MVVARVAKGRQLRVVAAMLFAMGCGSDGGGSAGSFIGNPAAARYPEGEGVYARNPWDMVVHGGRLYIGSGNSSNEGPASNAGPVPVFTYDLARGFEQDFAVDDEQIDVFVPAGEALLIPGHDAREAWGLGNFYELRPGETWQKYRTIPRAIHDYAMVARDGLLFAGLGTLRGGVVGVSRDGGLSWEEHRAPGFRIHAFLETQGQLHATGVFSEVLRETLGYQSISRWTEEGGFVPSTHLGVRELFPGAELHEDAQVRVVRPLVFGDSAVYLGGHVHNDHQAVPFGAYLAHDLEAGVVDVRALEVPDGFTPWDIGVEDGELHLLLNKRLAEGRWSVLIRSSEDGVEWRDRLRWQAPALARSFARLQDAWYLGLGSEVRDPASWTQDELDPATGEIWRLPGR